MMNFKDVKDLIDLISGTDVLEVEVERGGVRIRVRRDGGVHAAGAPVLQQLAPAASQPQAAAAVPAPLVAKIETAPP